MKIEELGECFNIKDKINELVQAVNHLKELADYSINALNEKEAQTACKDCKGEYTKSVAHFCKCHDHKLRPECPANQEQTAKVCSNFKPSKLHKWCANCTFTEQAHQPTQGCQERCCKGTPPSLEETAKEMSLAMSGILPTQEGTCTSCHKAIDKYGACGCRKKEECEYMKFGLKCPEGNHEEEPQGKEEYPEAGYDPGCINCHMLNPHTKHRTKGEFGEEPKEKESTVCLCKDTINQHEGLKGRCNGWDCDCQAFYPNN